MTRQTRNGVLKSASIVIGAVISLLGAAHMIGWAPWQMKPAEAARLEHEEMVRVAREATKEVERQSESRDEALIKRIEKTENAVADDLKVLRQRTWELLQQSRGR